MARRLKTFESTREGQGVPELRSRNVRVQGFQKKGYLIAPLLEVFERYLGPTPENPSQPSQASQPEPSGAASAPETDIRDGRDEWDASPGAGGQEHAEFEEEDWKL